MRDSTCDNSFRAALGRRALWICGCDEFLTNRHSLDLRIAQDLQYSTDTPRSQDRVQILLASSEVDGSNPDVVRDVVGQDDAHLLLKIDTHAEDCIRPEELSCQRSREIVLPDVQTTTHSESDVESIVDEEGDRVLHSGRVRIGASNRLKGVIGAHSIADFL